MALSDGRKKASIISHDLITFNVILLLSVNSIITSLQKKTKHTKDT